MSFGPPVVPDDAVYTSCWCEENVNLLGRYFSESYPDYKLHVVIVSNEEKSVVVCQAKACTDPGLIPGFWGVIWDYHVILLVSSKEESWVYDFDSRLPAGCEFDEYVKGTFPYILEDSFQSWFRVIPIQKYIDYFASDRSHMLLPNGTYIKPPPVYPPIKGRLATSSNNLFSRYVDMVKEELITESREQRGEGYYGSVMTLNVFRALFGN